MLDATQSSTVLNQVSQVVVAVGGLGTAAFGLLEAIKPVFSSINRVGFGGISKTVASITPPEGSTGPTQQAPLNSLPGPKVLESLLSNWINGTDLVSQKAIAKSLIKLHMSPGNATALAAATNVDAGVLSTVAASMVTGAALTQPQGDTYSRFDLIVTAMLDECYQKADQVYRNSTRGLAAVIAVILALVGGFMLQSTGPTLGVFATLKAMWFYLWSVNGGEAFVVGLLATPLAPIAKDISSALSTAVNAMQAVKKL